MPTSPMKRACAIAPLLVVLHVISASVFAGFRVKPYLVDPYLYGVTVVWFSNENVPGTLTVTTPTEVLSFTSMPTCADALTYDESERQLLDPDAPTDPPYRHVIRLSKMTTAVEVPYEVQQGDEHCTGTLMTAPTPYQPVRFIVFADCETEPESTGKPTEWPEPGGDQGRKYLVDQTEGFKQNLRIIQARRPGFLAFAGDIAESGGEQRDWDELWRHLNGDLGDIGGSIPLIVVPGNHDAYGGPGDLGRYEPEAHLRAIAKYRTYFTTPVRSNQAAHDYHRLDYGPVTLISLDSTNGLPERSEHDTNWLLDVRDGDHDFNPGSRQYKWLEAQLADAQQHSVFTFVQFHHVPYSVGPHGFKPGDPRTCPRRRQPVGYAHASVDGPVHAVRR